MDGTRADRSGSRGPNVSDAPYRERKDRRRLGSGGGPGVFPANRSRAHDQDYSWAALTGFPMPDQHAPHITISRPGTFSTSFRKAQQTRPNPNIRRSY